MTNMVMIPSFEVDENTRPRTPEEEVAFRLWCNKVINEFEDECDMFIIDTLCESFVRDIQDE